MRKVVEVELGEDLAHLATVGAAFEIVKFQQALRISATISGHARIHPATEPYERSSERRHVRGETHRTPSLASTIGFRTSAAQGAPANCEWVNDNSSIARLTAVVRNE